MQEKRHIRAQSRRDLMELLGNKGMVEEFGPLSTATASLLPPPRPAPWGILFIREMEIP